MLIILIFPANNDTSQVSAFLLPVLIIFNVWNCNHLNENGIHEVKYMGHKDMIKFVKTLPEFDNINSYSSQKYKCILLNVNTYV